MKQTFIILFFPIISFAQVMYPIGDVDCSGDINSNDATLILQYVTNNIDSLPCEENMSGLSPEQLQEMIDMLGEQVNNSNQPINMFGPMYRYSEFPEFVHFKVTEFASQGLTVPDDYEFLYYFDAVKFCSQLEYGGFNDWRMPSINELQNWINNNPLNNIGITNKDDGIDSFYTYIDFKNSILSSNGGWSFSVQITGPDHHYPNQLYRPMSNYIPDAYTSCFCVR